MITVEATAPGGHEQAGVLLIKAGTCSIRANRFIESTGGTQWLWALESKCPILQVLQVFVADCLKKNNFVFGIMSITLRLLYIKLLLHMLLIALGRP